MGAVMAHTRRRVTGATCSGGASARRLPPSRSVFCSVESPHECANDWAVGWENWRAFLAGAPRLGAVELTCYTDAHITGQVGTLGPYALLNPVALARGIGHAIPGLILRIHFHLDRADALGMTTTDYTRYHGGDLGDELKSLISLALGIRLRSGGQT